MIKYRVILLVSLLAPLLLTKAAQVYADSLNDTKTFKAFKYGNFTIENDNIYSGANGTYVDIDATCRAVTPNAFIYVADNAWDSSATDGYVSQDHVDSLAERFDGTSVDSIYSVNREKLGFESPDSANYGDGNHHIITILLYDVDEDASTYTVGDDFRSGYFNPVNETLRSADENSNGRKMLYLDTVPTQGPENSELDITKAYAPLARSFAREIFHYRDNNGNEASWNEEEWVVDGVTEWATLANGLDFDSSLVAAFLDSGSGSGHNSDFIDNRERQDKGASFLLVAYLAERAGDIAVENLVGATETGENGFQAVLGDVLFSNFVTDFARANFFDGTTDFMGHNADFYDTTYSYDNLNIASYDLEETNGGATGDTRDGMDPDELAELFTSTEGRVRPFATLYHTIELPDNYANIKIVFDGDDPAADVTAATLSLAAGIKWTGEGWRFKPITLDALNEGELILDGIATQVEKTVIIVTNRTALSIQFSFTLERHGNEIPLSPTNLSATTGNGFVTLNWDASEEFDVYNYMILRSDVGDMIMIPESTYTDSTAVNGTTYTYGIKAIDRAGNQSTASQVEATPSAPSSSGGGGGGGNSSGCFIATTSFESKKSGFFSFFGLQKP